MLVVKRLGVGLASEWPPRQPWVTFKLLSFRTGELPMGCRLENRESSSEWPARAARGFQSRPWVSPEAEILAAETGLLLGPTPANFVFKVR